MHLKILALAAACACTLLPSALADPGPVPPPTVAWAEDGPDGVTITWQAPVVADGVDGYIVFREGQAIASLPDTQTQYVDADGNSTNVYEVKSVDDAGHRSAPMLVAMLSSPCYLLDPSTPPFLFIDPAHCVPGSIHTGDNMARTLHDPPILDD